MVSFHTVRNVRGTSWRACRCGTWLDHWLNAMASTRTLCAAYDCGNPAEVGAHVYDVARSGGQDWSEYIAPLCRGCNADREEFELKTGVILIPANTRLMGCEMG